MQAKINHPIGRAVLFGRFHFHMVIHDMMNFHQNIRPVHIFLLRSQALRDFDNGILLLLLLFDELLSIQIIGKPLEFSGLLHKCFSYHHRKTHHFRCISKASYQGEIFHLK